MALDGGGHTICSLAQLENLMHGAAETAAGTPRSGAQPHLVNFDMVHGNTLAHPGDIATTRV